MTFGQIYPRLFEGCGIRRQAWQPNTIVRLSNITGNHLMIYLPNNNVAVYCPMVVDLYDKELQQMRDDWEVVL